MWRTQLPDGLAFVLNDAPRQILCLEPELALSCSGLTLTSTTMLMQSNARTFTPATTLMQIMIYVASDFYFYLFP